MSFAMTETEKNWLLASAAAAAGEYVGFSSGDVCGAWPLALAAAAVAAFAMFGACLPRWYLVPVFLTALAAAMASECGSRETLDGILELSRGRARDVLVEVEKDARVFSARGGDAMCAFPGDMRGVRVKVVMPLLERPPLRGDLMRVTGWLSRDADARTGRRALVVKGRGAGAEFAGRTLAGRAVRRCAALRASLARSSAKGLEDRRGVAVVLGSLLFGRSAEMPAADMRVYARAGTSHVFAVSGLHVMTVAFLFARFLQLVGVSRRFLVFPLVPATAVYVAVAGAPPSAVRALVMTLVYFASSLFWRRPSAVCAVSAAFFLASAADLRVMTEPGAVFSFAVTFALAAFSASVRGKRADGLRRAFAGAFAFSAVAWYAGAPVSAAVFGRVSVAALFVNWLVVPLAGFAVTAGLLGAVSGFVFEPLAVHLNNLAALAAGAMKDLSFAAASSAFACVDMDAPSFGVVLAWYSTPLVFASFPWIVRRGIFSFRRKNIV